MLCDLHGHGSTSSLKYHGCSKWPFEFAWLQIVAIAHNFNGLVQMDTCKPILERNTFQMYINYFTFNDTQTY